ncbi:MAG: leucyl aminopeptidase [Sulfurospirillum sp.]|nr:leucyl aminopeptidase [Sulfurospirillum sp.]MBL0703700.1 leucyl aminopeptidase [Sulfurospirillum sp.]
MKIVVENKKIDDVKADIKIVFVLNKDFNHKWVEDKKTLEFLGFKAKSEECCFLTEKKIVYVGIDSLQSEEIRLASSKAINIIKNTNAKSVKIGTYANECPGVSIKVMSEAFILGSYSFQEYKTKKDPLKLETITICLDDYSKPNASLETAKKAVKVGTIIANSTNYAKDLVNTIPHDMTSVELAKVAQKLDKIDNVTCKIYDENFLKEQKMGAFLAVNRASHIPPRLIHLIYKPKNAKKKFVYVGKGLTYDSGGLSLKPSASMVSMKSDMGGGAAVLGILKGAAQIGLPYEIHAIIGATENSIGPEAYKPDDVLVAKNGKTIEIGNTDAEGRLVLADCLCYASELKPDYLIDIATLTGACVVAFGEYTTAVMGHSCNLKNSLMSSAVESGELTGTLPFNRYLKEQLKSPIADLSNIGKNGWGGTITAGMFLDNFVEDNYKDKWLHLDIAGPAFVDKNWGYNQCGASGAGVRMNLYWMIDQSKKEDN